MDRSRLEQLLSENYDITNVEIKDGPRQFVAETFICSVSGVSKYFIKVLAQTDPPRKIVQSLSVLSALSQARLQNIPQVILTKNDQLLVENDEFLFILFSFIEGEQTFKYDNALLGRFIANLHETTGKVNAPVEKELFSSYVDRVFPKTFDQSLESSTDSIKEELRKTLLPYETEIRGDWDIFQQIIQECKNVSSDNFVLTHGDAPGNVIVNNSGELFVIDWDAMMLAPPERDVWFLKDNSHFMQGYKEKYPEYQLNTIFYNYYLLWRMFDDLFGWMGEILSNKSETHRRKNLEDLKSDYFNWLRPLVRMIK
jgi:thiamine kinase-like enzyme